ncbi:hypothetical protein BABINDRAFT_168139 [Babjeviella inositovora NRRL Y-12698]|uniref:CN hydrolase domain-containing protein n=1 Tax=Babjeviella inositovora NRRL Y-12698 TaxID=984486 RepID=A0A1E3QL31_9ASCO|nr:uncharacterized protein BABINDRAFT_168139 [Babjeviella inositovora NRRL Y-12698]ODQ78393.1 hypothetical protein BABINDRAFT_168139 [Babjeviella inositovora NRRL Y-12698]
MTHGRVPLLAKKLKIALLQVAPGTSVSANLTKVEEYATNAKNIYPDVDLLMLPEFFNSPYDVAKFREYAEPIPNGKTTKFLSLLARSLSVIIVGGSIPELDGEKVYNTSVTFNVKGELIGKHRKVHLFDLDSPKGAFRESDSLFPGDKATNIALPSFGQIGLAICYDIKFPELAAIAARKHNAFAMFYPGSFNATSGQLLGRSRAIDNQIFTVLCSPARNPDSGLYPAYGHSLVVDPFGKIIAEAGEGEQTVFCELDPEVIHMARESIPVSLQRRFDVYDDISVNAKINED